MNISLLGWNGAKNVGDDAMTLAMLLTLSKEDNIKQVTLFSRSQSATFEYLKSYNFPYKIKIDYSISNFKNRYFKYIYIRIIFPILLVISSNIIIIGGGSLFHSSSNNLIYLIVIFLSRTFFRSKKIKIYSFGTSVGPFYSKRAEKYFTYIAKYLHKLVVRDNRSYIYCKNLIGEKKLEKYDDLVISLPYANQGFENISFYNKPYKYIVIILRRNKISTKQYNWLNGFLEFTHNKDINYKFVFVTFCDLEDNNENDLEEINMFFDKMSYQLKRTASIIKYNENLERIYNLIISATFIISARLHGGIISYSLNKKFIMLSYHPKCNDFYNEKTLNKIGIIDEQVDCKDYDNIYTYIISSESTKCINYKLEWLNKIIQNE